MAFDLLSFLLGKSTGSGGGGGSAALGPKTIRQNGVYRAASDNLDGYNTVTVEVPNSYAAADNGKVVSNGALVAQTSRTITQNGTFDTTLNNEVVVNVPSGGGGDIDPLIMGAINGTVASETATQIGQAFAFATGQYDINLPNASSWTRSGGAYAFESSTGVRNVRIAKMPTIGSYGFRGCVNLESIFAPKASVRDYSFSGCSKLKTAVLLNFTSYRGFDNCSLLEKVDITQSGNTGKIDNLWQVGCPAFNTLIIRGSGVLTLSNITAFASTPFADGGTGGMLYVPQALIASYQAATNWSTILGYTNNQILPIEGSIYETQYADGTPIAA